MRKAIEITVTVALGAVEFWLLYMSMADHTMAFIFPMIIFLLVWVQCMLLIEKIAKENNDLPKWHDDVHTMD